MTLISLFIIRNAIAIGIILSSNPITLSIWVLLTAIIISTCLGFSSISWYGLVLFIIYIGGILVIFSYFTAIQPNQHLEIKKIFILSTISIISLLNLKSTIVKPIMLISRASSKPYLFLINHSSPVFVILASTLFLALVAVVKVSKFSIGPLRPFSYV